MVLKLYSKPYCQQCRMTKKILELSQIDYQEYNLDNYPIILKKFKQQGLKQTPILCNADDKVLVSGFQIDQLQNLIRNIRNNSNS